MSRKVHCFRSDWIESEPTPSQCHCVPALPPAIVDGERLVSRQNRTLSHTKTSRQSPPLFAIEGPCLIITVEPRLDMCAHTAQCLRSLIFSPVRLTLTKLNEIINKPSCMQPRAAHPESSQRRCRSKKRRDPQSAHGSSGGCPRPS